MNRIKIIIAFCGFFIFQEQLAAQEVEWMKMPDALAMQEESPRNIIVDLYTDWCGYCKKMDQTTFKDKEIVGLLNDSFYSVKLNGESKETIMFRGAEFGYYQQGRRVINELADWLTNGRLAYPTLVVLNKKQEPVAIIPGYRNASELKKILVKYQD